MPFLLALLCLALSSCTSATSPSAPLDREFTLAPGDTVAIEDTTVALRFAGVEGDSRCPADAFCIQGGDALVNVDAISADGTTRCTLHTGNSTPVVYQGLTIALVGLTPYPFSSRTIAPGDYRATLKVTR